MYHCVTHSHLQFGHARCTIHVSTRSLITHSAHYRHTPSGFLQASVSNTTTAFAVSRTAAGAATVALTDDVPPSACRCSKQLSTGWDLCGETVAAGQACGCVDIPCTAALQLTPVAPDIACPADEAAAAPISFPTSSAIQIQLQYEDGTTRPARYPPPNGDTLQVRVTQGAASCEVDYDGTAAPVVRTSAGAGCGAAVCVINATYSSPCQAQSVSATVQVWAVVVECLQGQAACHDAGPIVFGEPPVASGCSPVPASTLRQLLCNPADFQQRTLWTAARLSAQHDKPRGSYIDVSGSVAITSSTPAIVNLAQGIASTAISNRIRPQALGAATITATLGTKTVSADITVAGTTAIGSLSLEPAFDSSGVDAGDPSEAACSRTFRGDIGNLSELIGVFDFTETDALSCPVRMPLGTLSRSSTLDDVLTLQTAMAAISSAAPASMAVTPAVWTDPAPTGYDLQLQDSAAVAVSITARSTCVAAGAPDVVASADVYANLEARETFLDIGSRCGPPLAAAAAAGVAPLLRVGELAAVPLYLTVSGGKLMKSVSAVVTYDDSVLRVRGVRSPETAPARDACGAAPFYDGFTLADATFTVNFGDTNAVTVALVWANPTMMPRIVNVIAIICVEVLAATPAPLAFATNRLNIRYFTSAASDAVEVTAATPDELRAGSAPFATAAAGSRRLLSAGAASMADETLRAESALDAPVDHLHEQRHSKHNSTPTGAGDITLVTSASHAHASDSTSCSRGACKLASNADLTAHVLQQRQQRSLRKLLQASDPTVSISDTAFPWMDLNADAAVDTRDALLFADMIKLVDSTPALHCTWLESVYLPSAATTPHQVVRGNGFTDASFTALTSTAWQALDPKLIYLRSNVSDVMYPGVDCATAGSGALAADQRVPQLTRFDGTVPLTEPEFQAVVPGAAGVDLFRAFMRPDEARDWRMFMNAVLGNTAFVVGIEVVTRTDSVDILVTTRNNATFDRTPSKFWPGNTQVFVELLMLEGTSVTASAVVPMADPGTVSFMHDVWPKKVTYEAFTDASGLAGTYQKAAPATGMLEQRASNGALLYTTHYCEAELLEEASGLEGAVYRVALATAQLSARRAAVAATLFTWRQQQDSVHIINPYYGSMLARNTAEYDEADAGNQQYNFLPYAIMDLGCPAVPYEPELYFVNSHGAVPAAGMAHDGSGGVTVLALLRLARAFEKPTVWAAVEASEMLVKNLTLAEAGEALVSATPRRAVEWCWSRSGTINDTGSPPGASLHALHHVHVDNHDHGSGNSKSNLPQAINYRLCYGTVASGRGAASATAPGVVHSCEPERFAARVGLHGSTRTWPFGEHWDCRHWDPGHV
eukprot:jgi/Ulvmu1/10118/UM006_0069.1